MRFIMALALLWITQLQATSSLLEEAELQAAQDPVGYLQRLDASPQQNMELFYARALAQAALGRYQQALLDNARARGLASAQQELRRLLDFRLQQIALTLDTEAPEQALHLLTQLRPAVLGHAQQESEWHALNGLALYRTQQLKEAIAELKTAFQLKQKGPRSALATLQRARLLMTLGNLYADLSLHREAESYYQDALGQMVRLNEPNSQVIIRANMARLYIDMARPDRARELLDALLATPGLSPHYRAIVLGYQAMVFNAQRDWHSAWQSLEEAQAIYEGLGYPQAASRLTEIRARTLQGRGETQLALQQENENKRQQLLYQQSARYYQMMLVVLLIGALILLGLTTHRLHRSSRHLYKLATFDQLTGLPNRRALLERLEQQWQLDAPLTLLIIDIDHFKQINDRHGHQTGDQAIRQLARELKNWAPDLQQVGRWGGEEFLVAMAQDGITCWRLAEQLRNRIAYLAAPHMTISIGVAERSPDDDSLSQLIHRADMAMYQAKRQGRNQTILAPTPNQPVSNVA